MLLVIDISEYQDSYTFEKFKYLIEQGSVAGVIIRAGCAHAEDDMLPTFVNWCRQLSVPFGLYYYFYPGLTPQSQTDLFISLVNEYPDCKSVWVDIEEYKNFTTGVVIPPDKLNAFYKTVFTTMYYAFPDKVVGNYSGSWVLDAYIPEMYLWAAKYPLWAAYYVKSFYWYQRTVASLGARWDSSDVRIPITKLQDIIVAAGMNPVPNPKGFPHVNLWQFLTWIPYIEGLTYWQSHIDLNVCEISDFFKIFPEDPVPEPPVVNKLVRGFKKMMRII